MSSNALAGAMPKWGTSLITFFHPTFFGLAADTPYGDYVDAAYRDARGYFDLMLDTARDAGLQGVELAPPPAGWEGALMAYGTPAGVKAALDDRGLVLASSYMESGPVLRRGMEEPSARPEIDEEVARHARFLEAVGCDLIVMGTPSRLELGPDCYGMVPRALFERLASELNRIAAVAARHGCRVALHTDAYSLCSRDNDIDTLMSLTDPDTVALCLDSGHVTLDGGDPVAILSRHIDRIPVAHWKDADQALDGRTLEGDFLERHAVMMSHFRWVGEGIVDWDRYLDVLGKAGWRGWAHAEFDFAEDPAGVLRAHVDICRARIAALVSS
jgi:inosose dehydratase